MSKRKPLDKAQARERRDRLLESAAAAELSLTEGVREMRAIAGMTQDEFAQHRGVSARVIKAIELGQGNPTVATLNRIGQFFGLEIGFVPIRRTALPTVEPHQTAVAEKFSKPPFYAGLTANHSNSPLNQNKLDMEAFEENIRNAIGRELSNIINEPSFQRKFVAALNNKLTSLADPQSDFTSFENILKVDNLPPAKKKKLRSR